MSIADGRKIAIRFTQPLIGDVLGNETKFAVSFDEYNYVPGGTASRKTRIPIGMENSLDDNTIILTFAPGCANSIQRAIGDIMVTYDGSGTLMGQGGPVLAFEKTFTPIGLDPKNNPHDAEHIDLDITVDAALKRVLYTNSYTTENIDLNVTVSGVLTHINDL